MFRRLQKQLQDTELGTGCGTTGKRTCTYVQVQWGYTWTPDNTVYNPLPSKLTVVFYDFYDC
jgi:hypothetical protein